MEFKKGDIVKGNSQSDREYSLTNSKMIGVVTEISVDKRVISIRVLSHSIHPEVINKTFDLNSSYFELAISKKNQEI
jgi:hypothetical protein